MKSSKGTEGGTALNRAAGLRYLLSVTLPSFSCEKSPFYKVRWQVSCTRQLLGLLWQRRGDITPVNSS